MGSSFSFIQNVFLLGKLLLDFGVFYPVLFLGVNECFLSAGGEPVAGIQLVHPGIQTAGISVLGHSPGFQHHQQLLGTDVALFGGGGEESQIAGGHRAARFEFQGDRLHDLVGIDVVLGRQTGGRLEGGISEDLGGVSPQRIGDIGLASEVADVVPAVHLVFSL